MTDPELRRRIYRRFAGTATAPPAATLPAALERHELTGALRRPA